MPTLWFSYSTVHGLDAPEPPNSPYSLTWNVGRFLRDKALALGYQFRYINLDDTSEPIIWKNDIVIGHTWWPNGFMSHALKSTARLKFILQPYSHEMIGPNERPWLRGLVDHADHCFWVTGPYWYDTMQDGPFGDWKVKSTRLDMAINPALHPHSKTHWNPPGKRKFLAIGVDAPCKGLDLIADLARQGGFHLGYFGNAPFDRFAHVPQLTMYGGREFTPEVQRAIANEYDFFISLARADANPTTLLETASWGMLPMCNQESGYLYEDPFPGLRIDGPLLNLHQIDQYQNETEWYLKNRVTKIQHEIAERHTWPIFCQKLWAEIEKWL